MVNFFKRSLDLHKSKRLRHSFSWFFGSWTYGEVMTVTLWEALYVMSWSPNLEAINGNVIEVDLCTWESSLMDRDEFC